MAPVSLIGLRAVYRHAANVGTDVRMQGEQVDEFQFELKRRILESLTIEGERNRENRERTQRATTCHKELHDWLRGVANDSQSSIQFSISKKYEDDWPRNIGGPVSAAFPVSLTWPGTPGRTLRVGVDTKQGWVIWSLLDTRSKAVDSGRVDPRSFSEGLQSPILRLATASEWHPKESDAD